VTLQEQLIASGKELSGHLRNPVKLRFSVMGAMWLLGCSAMIRPFTTRIENFRNELSRQQDRAETIASIVNLNQQIETCGERVLRCGHFNEWVQSVMHATRGENLLVRNLELRDTWELGPYHVISLTIEMEAHYHGLFRLVEWIENPARANRVDALHITRDNDYLYVTMDILGLVEKHEPAK
jgi:hypothetical protein